MKKKVTLFILLFFVLFAHANNEAKLIITQKTGNETVLSLSSNPTLTFQDEDMIVETEFTIITIPIKNIDSYWVENLDNVNNITIKPYVSNGHITFTDIPIGTPVCVFTIDGKNVFSQKPDVDGIVDICIETLPRGIYIVKALNNIIKITNK